MRMLRPFLAVAICSWGTNPALADDFSPQAEACGYQGSSPALADDLPPADLRIEQVVDRFIDEAIAIAAATPAGQADDATLIRRLTLDLVGRIPTLGEVDRFVASTDRNKRAKLVDNLIASPGFSRHQAAQFETMLTPEGARANAGLRDYLLRAMAANRGWDQIFRELMLPDESDPKMKGAAEFIRARVKESDKLTNDVSVAFFGVNVSCAQCHDHPLVKSWTQDHFYGMQAFLNRTYDNNGFLGERGYGVVRFKPNKGQERTAKMMFLTGAAIDDPSTKEQTTLEQKKEKEFLDKAKKDKTAPPKPKFSARAKLVEVALQPAETNYFARSIVNRMWHRMFGLGLVNPLDQMHAENPPFHPELLDWLARDTESHEYDLKRLIRGLVMSKAYSRSSAVNTESRPDARLFAVARLKPLTPLQLASSLKIAAVDPVTFDNLKDADFDKRIEQLESSARGYAVLFAQPTDNFQIGVSEALLFSNSPKLMKELLTNGTGTLLGRVKSLSEQERAVQLLVRTVHGRKPTEDETKALTAYLRKRTDRPDDAYQQVLWALLSGPEFRFNY